MQQRKSEEKQQSALHSWMKHSGNTQDGVLRTDCCHGLFAGACSAQRKMSAAAAWMYATATRTVSHTHRLCCPAAWGQNPASGLDAKHQSASNGWHLCACPGGCHVPSTCCTAYVAASNATWTGTVMQYLSHHEALATAADMADPCIPKGCPQCHVTNKYITAAAGGSSASTAVSCKSRCPDRAGKATDGYAVYPSAASACFGGLCSVLDFCLLGLTELANGSAFWLQT